MYAGLLLPIELLGPDLCYPKIYVCRIAVIELFQGPDFCYHKSYYVESLLPIELLGPDFCYHKSYVCRIAASRAKTWYQ